MAGEFASKFGSKEWGNAVGLTHDAGKSRLEWQQYLRLKSGYFDEEAHLEGKPGKMPHAIHGAKLVEEFHGKGIGRVYHIVLPAIMQDFDWSSAEGTGQASQISTDK